MANLLNYESQADFIQNESFAAQQLYEGKLSALKEQGAGILETGLPASSLLTSSLATSDAGKSVISNVYDYIGSKLGITDTEGAKEFTLNLLKGEKLDINGLKAKVQSKIDEVSDDLQGNLEEGVSGLDNLTQVPSSLVASRDVDGIRNMFETKFGPSEAENELDFETPFGVNNFKNINSLSSDNRFISSEVVAKEPLGIEGTQMTEGTNFNSKGLPDLNEEDEKIGGEALDDTKVAAEGIGETTGEVAGEETAGLALDATGVGAAAGLVLGLVGIGTSIGEAIKDFFDKPKENFTPQFIPAFQA